MQVEPACSTSSAGTPELTCQGVFFTCVGRGHPDADSIFVEAAERRSHQRGLADASGTVRFTECRLTVVIWRRAARMTQKSIWLHTDEMDLLDLEHECLQTAGATPRFVVWELCENSVLQANDCMQPQLAYTTHFRSVQIGKLALGWGAL